MIAVDAHLLAEKFYEKHHKMCWYYFQELGREGEYYYILIYLRKCSAELLHYLRNTDFGIKVYPCQ